MTKPLCKCGSKMVIKTNRKTKEKFLGCFTYPICTHTKPINNSVYTHDDKALTSRLKAAETSSRSLTAKYREATAKRLPKRQNSILNELIKADQEIAEIRKERRKRRKHPTN